MKRSLKKVFALALAAAMFIGMSCLEVFAADVIETVDSNVVMAEAEIYDVIAIPRAVTRATTFTDAVITISYNESYGLHTTVETSTSKTASVIGIKNIRIQEKVWYGWNTVCTSTGLEEYNSSSFGVSVYYSGVIEGKYYRVKATHYADVDGYRELENETSGFLCAF